MHSTAIRFGLVLVVAFGMACGSAVRPDGGADGGADGVAVDNGIVTDGAGADVPTDAVIKPDAPPPDADDVVVADADDVPIVTDADDVPTIDVPVGMDIPVVPDVPAPLDGPTFFDAPACSLPIVRALTLPSDTAMGTTMGMSRIPTASCAATGGPEQIYTLHVMTRTGVILTTNAMFDTVLSIRRACDSMTGEIACNDDIMGGNLNSRIRTTLDPGDYFVVVDTFAMGTGGMYTLTLTSFSPAANSTCATAATLTPGTAAMGDVLTGGAPSMACLMGANGPQLWYSLTIPAGQRATLTAVPMGAMAWTPALRVVGACGATSCISGTQSPGAGTAAGATVDNRGAAPLMVFVSVSSTTPASGGPVTLSASLSAVPPLVANADCTMARVVTPPAMITGENAAAGTNRLNATCLGGAQGTVLYYRVDVPARSTLVATATPQTDWDPAVRLLAACGAATCVASSNASGSFRPERLVYGNTSGATQTVIIAVGGVDPIVSGLFDLQVQILPPPTNTTCPTATDVIDGTTLRSQNSAAGTENATAACLATATGAVLYYRAMIPAGQTLQARVTPAPTMDAVIRLESACGVTSCLGTANGGAVGAAETLTYTNSSAATQTVILAIGGATNATNGIFDLAVTIARNYVETTIPVACDDMTGGTAVMGVGGDDTVSGILDLPFAITFFGENELEYSVSSNGLFQLYPTLTGTPSNSYTNVAIPTAGAPDRFLAPFWDDLFPVMGSSVLIRTLGTAPNRRHVVQWTSFAHYADMTARLTFQAKVFETTNVIEFHYCTLTAGAMAPLVTGSSATIGIENVAGTSGRQHSFDTAMSVSAANAIRFTP